MDSIFKSSVGQLTNRHHNYSSKLEVEGKWKRIKKKCYNSNFDFEDRCLACIVLGIVFFSASAIIYDNALIGPNNFVGGNDINSLESIIPSIVIGIIGMMIGATGVIKFGTVVTWTVLIAGLGFFPLMYVYFMILTAYGGVLSYFSL